MAKPMLDDTGAISEIGRKLALLADAYWASPLTKHLPKSIREQHKSMFGLSVYKVDDVLNPHSLSRSRSGLIITEKLLGLLTFDLTGKETSFQGLISRGSVGKDWAPFAMDEWSEAGSGWWLLPVLPEIMSEPSSSVRSVVVGLEAMGFVEKKAAVGRPTPKSRGKVIRITASGREFFERLKE